MKRRKGSTGRVIVSLVAAAVGSAGCGSSSPEVRVAEGAAVSGANAAATGQELYSTLCATCHGTEADGEGPLAYLLRVETPDLRSLSARHGGEFPRASVRSKIDGTDEVGAHGTRVMPVWGRVLRRDSDGTPESEEAVDRQIDNLVAYLASIQES